MKTAPASAVGVDLVVADGPSPLSGRVRTGGGQPARDLFVILFAREADAWASPAVRVFAAQPDQDGRFVRA